MKVESHFDSNNSRGLWQGLRILTDCKPPPRVDGLSPSLSDELNNFYYRFEAERQSAPSPPPPPPPCKHHACPPRVWTMDQHLTPRCWNVQRKHTPHCHYLNPMSACPFVELTHARLQALMKFLGASSKYVQRNWPGSSWTSSTNPVVKAKSHLALNRQSLYRFRKREKRSG